jgi:hypothetical protein
VAIAVYWGAGFTAIDRIACLRTIAGKVVVAGEGSAVLTSVLRVAGLDAIADIVVTAVQMVDNILAAVNRITAVVSTAHLIITVERVDVDA